MKRAIDQTEPGFLEVWLDRSRRDLDFYNQSALMIRDKQSRMVPLVLNPPQQIVQAKLSAQLKREGKIRAVVLKARQEGVSTLTAARFFRVIHLWPGINAMVVADSLERAEVLFNIYDRYHENLPPEIKPPKKATQRGRYMAFPHDSTLSVRPATDTEAGRAMTLHRLHASELAFWGEHARDTWISLLQAVPQDSGEVVVESTAKGAGGLFHELWELAETGETGWISIFLPWWIHDEYEVEPNPEEVERISEDPDDFEQQAQTTGFPYEGEYHRLNLRKLAWRRRVIVDKFGGNPVTLGKDAVRAFQQEYPATAEEAFLMSGACFFDEEALRVMARNTEEPVSRGRLVLSEDRQVRLEPSDRGFVKVWEKPKPDGHYVVGADTAEGKLVAARSLAQTSDPEDSGRDYSCAVVLKVEETGYRVVAEVWGHVVPEVFADQIRLLGKWYACGPPNSRQPALVGVERNHSSGQTVLRLLREHHHYVPLHWAREINYLTKQVTRRVGWVTSAETRMPMLDELGQKVRQAQIFVPGKDAVREMVTFVVWENGKPAAEEGCHDDRVIALAIAVQMAREHRHAGASPLPSWQPNPDSQTGY